MVVSSTVACPTPTVIILAGVSGTGKTTIGQQLSADLHYKYIEGDDYHTAENKEKMGNGIPLTDVDREPWLEKLHLLIADCLHHHQRAIIACSALKYAYRRTLVQDIPGEPGEIQFVLLTADRTVLQQRLQQRSGHYMKAGMLQSQLDTLEAPHADESIITVDVSPSIEQVIQTIKQKIMQTHSSGSKV